MELFDFKGSITDVGVQRGPRPGGRCRVANSREVRPRPPLDLSRTTVILEHLFVDAAPGGLGELMTTIDNAPVVPLLLESCPNNRENNGVFDQPRVYRPYIRLQIVFRKGAYEVRLKLDRGLMRRRPRVCEENTEDKDLPLTPITHGLLLDDGINPPVEILTAKNWVCTRPGRCQMRRDDDFDAPPPPPPPPTVTPPPRPTPTPRPTVTAPPTAPPPAGNEPPTASLRTDQHIPDGELGLVELDGSSSSDRDGQVVRYRFESGDGRVQDGPEPRARFVYPPGDYRASLVVFDDRGTASKPASRGFSVK